MKIMNVSIILIKCKNLLDYLQSWTRVGLLLASFLIFYSLNNQ